MTKTTPWTLEPPPLPATSLVRGAAARALRRSGTALRHWARRLQARRPQPPAGDPLFEFHAEAGAPEGALYVDGQRVGVLPGVTRL